MRQEMDWEPKTKLGRMVKAGEITNMSQVFSSGLPMMEPEIVDILLPDMEEEVIDINLVQKMHRSGRRVRFRATVAIGNGNGYVGLGKAVAKEVGPAIRKGIRDAKLNLVQIRRGCGSWECGCGGHHSIPFKIQGQCGSVRVNLMPAPKGLGLAAGDVTKKLLRLAGVKDIWVKSQGQTKSTTNNATASFLALKNTAFVKVEDEKKNFTEGMVEENG